MEDYANIYFRPLEKMILKIWNPDTESFRFVDLKNGMPELEDHEIPLFPVGKEDIENRQIYQGDIVVVEIETRYGLHNRGAVVRTEGFYSAGLDYFDENGYITEDGDFLGDFYVQRMKVVGSIFDFIAEDKEFNLYAYVEDF
jgi:hypothetical protein